MKKKLLAAVASCLAAVACCFSSCSWLSGLGKSYYIVDDHTTARAHTAKLLEAMENKDKTALKAMFSPNAIAAAENFDESIEQLFEYFQGTDLSYEDDVPINCHESINYNDRIRILYCAYEVETSEYTYLISYEDTVIDTTDSDNVGIKSFNINRVDEDMDPNYRYYWGDDQGTPGINIGKRTPLSNDDLGNFLGYTEETEYVLRYIRTKNKEHLTPVLCDMADEVENLDEMLKALLDYYEGKKKNYSMTDMIAKESPDNDSSKRQRDATYEVETNKQTYRIAFRTIGSGIRSLYIIKAEDDTDLSVPYWGDGLFTPGIHIGIPNAVSASE